jgi:NADH-quinone oxidoreductase subunit M
MRELLLSVHYDYWILPALLILPLIGAALVLLSGRGSAADEDEVASGAAVGPSRLATIVFALEFLLSLGLWWTFDPAFAGWQQTFDRRWIDAWGIRFTLGLDGIALMMVLLTTFIMLLASLGSWTYIRRKTRSYYALMLILTTGMLGVFMALDLFLFYVMWEAMLIPMYFIVGIWGGERRIYASLKFFIYTMVGSLLMLAGIVYLGAVATPQTIVKGVLTPNFSYDAILTTARITPTAAYWLFGAFFVAFAVKVTMFPLHTWLTDAHV